MGGIERDEHDVLEARPEHHAGRLRVDPDVELGRDGRVSPVVAAAHDDRLGDPLHDPGLELDRHRDVGQRSDRHERDRVGRRHVGLDEEVDGAIAPASPIAVAGSAARARACALRADRLARDREVVARHRRRLALEDRDVALEEVDHAQRVVRAVLDRVVAVHRGRGDELQVRVERRQHQRDRIVGPGVDVEDQLPWHLATLDPLSGPRTRAAELASVPDPTAGPPSAATSVTGPSGVRRGSDQRPRLVLAAAPAA